MEGVLGFFVFVVAVSASGALSPGPLFVATVNHALKAGGRVGWVVAAGHTAFELPLVLALSLGVLSVVEAPFVKLVVGLLGAAALIAFGTMEAISSIRRLRSEGNERRGGDEDVKVRWGRGLWQAFLIGFLFTSLNPYFLIWWFTIGLTLIVKALTIASITGILLMYVFHVWLDYAWLGAVAHTSAAGSRFLNKRRVDLISTALAAILIGLGIWLLTTILS